MPIHIPPLNRRRFLAGSVAAGAGLLTAGELFGSEANRDPHSWALISDTHIATRRDEVSLGNNMTDNLTQVCGEVLAWDSRPGGVLLNGDCAFRNGQTGDYGTLLELLHPLREAGLPIHMTLGNHDHRERFFAAGVEKEPENSPVVDRHVSVIAAPRVNWFLLDSLEVTNQTQGMLGEKQLAWLAAELDRRADKPAIIAVHHNPGRLTGVKDTEALFDVIVPRKQVKAYIFGHTHHWQVKDRDGLYLINLPAVAYPFSKADPRGWVRLQLEDTGATLELRTIDRDHAAFGQQVSLKWRPA